MITNLYAFDLCTPREDSHANANGRMYREVSGSDGTQSSSTFTSAFTASINISSGIVAIHRRSLELIIRRAFISGRNN